jgi:hypothetical protein
VSDRLACAHVPLYQSLTDAGLSGLNCPGGWGDRLLLPSPMPCLEGESPSDRPKFSPVPWADRIGTQQSVIYRLEDADYEGHSLSMLQSIAQTLNQRLELNLVPLGGSDPEERA